MSGWHWQDNGTAKGAGLTLCAERQYRGHWWWGVFDDAKGQHMGTGHCATGILARAAAEAAAKTYLEGL